MGINKEYAFIQRKTPIVRATPGRVTQNQGQVPRQDSHYLREVRQFQTTQRGQDQIPGAQRPHCLSLQLYYPQAHQAAREGLALLFRKWTLRAEGRLPDVGGVRKETRLGRLPLHYLY